ncbi:hypothetical protein GBA65_11425 [Rubrobacter marinus]|uniref:Uncharacterized protein n=1 Tax=Rubrobacter marinus TaxID=2653852 RepID=A0A6G8PXS3_9ACTN|nr:solute carrier organic anion transporter [Rubrobacter marinus]QIN79032.1 hypothetical protein GBA65_11425 [Rubrobacter marinus]
MGDPRFWYGFVACAALVFLALLPGVLFPRRRTVVLYEPHDRAPVPYSDPFYNAGSEKLRHARTGTALREHRERLKQTRLSYDTRRSPQASHIREARKLAVWHPHPDDAMPSWGLW